MVNRKHSEEKKEEHLFSIISNFPCLRLLVAVTLNLE